MARLASLALALLLAGSSARAAKAPPEAATCVAFLPKSRSFVYGTRDGQVCVSGPNSRVLYEGKGPVVALAVSPDGRRVACCLGGEVLVLDTFRGRPIVVIRDRADFVAISADGRRFATVGGSGVKLWNAMTAKETQSLVTDDLWDSVTFSPDGHKVAGGSFSSIYLCDAINGKLLRQMTGVSGYMRGLAYTPDGRRLAAVGSGMHSNPAYPIYKASAELKVWDLATGQEVVSTKGYLYAGCGGVFCPQSGATPRQPTCESGHTRDPATMPEMTTSKPQEESGYEPLSLPCDKGSRSADIWMSLVAAGTQESPLF